jgi:hypothetical protein
MTTTIPLDEVFAPSLDEVLADSITGKEEYFSKRVPLDLLERFCRIAESPDTAAAVVAFAKGWGLLGLCEHGMPYPHFVMGQGDARIFDGLLTDASFDKPIRGAFCAPVAESYQHWKDLALRFDSLRRIGLDLNRGELGNSTDWQLAANDPDTYWQLEANANNSDLGPFSKVPSGKPIWRRETSLDRARIRYVFHIQRLIQISNLQPWFGWVGAWNIELSSYARSNILAILTMQLILRVSSAKTQVKCAECLLWFIPRRNQRKYCDSCGNRAAWRASKRKQRGE